MTNAAPPALLSLVIPCYNESDRIGLLFNGLISFKQKWKGPFEVIIVNDGSKDDFERLVLDDEFYKANRDIVTLHTQENTGKGGALRTGVLMAKGEYILTLDADMSAPPEELIRWYASWGGQPAPDTIYTGSREHKDSVIEKKNGRKVVGNIFNILVRVLTPLDMRDTQCGFKLYPTAEAKKIFGSLKTYGWAHDVELLYRAHLDGMKIVEMPLDWSAVENSKINVFKDGMKMIVEILSIVARIRGERGQK